MSVLRFNKIKPFALAIFCIFLSQVDVKGQCNPPIPTANFTYSPTLLCDSVNVTFSNTSNGAAMTYSWNFDDPASGAANTSTAANPSHIFKVGSQPDTFYVRLVVLDFCGKRDTMIKPLIVAPKPTADFGFTDSLCAGTLSFTNQSQGTGLSYHWSFGDGWTSDDTSSVVNHFYDTVGVGMVSHQVRLIAISPNGCADTLTKTRKVKMSPDPTIDDFTSTIPFSQCSSTSGFLLSIDNSSLTYSTNTSYIINWGDGSPRDTLSSSFFSDTHTYYGFGRFRLAVTAIGSNGCARTDTFNVYNGSNPSGGVNSPGSTINLCAPVRLGFPISSIQNNSPGTSYSFWVNDSTNVQSFIHPPPDTIFHTFLKSSCGTNIQGSPSYTNAYMITLLITNPCGQTSATIAPITISGRPVAAVSADKDTACVEREIVTLTDNSTSSTVLSSGSYNCATDMLRRWRVNRPSTQYELQTGSFLGGANFTTSPIVGPGPNHNGSSQLQVRFLDTGEFIFRLISGHPNNACGYDTIEYSIYVQDTVVASFALNMNPSNGCVDNVISMQNLSKGPVQRYNWTVTPTTGFNFVNSTADSAEPILRFTEAGEFTISMQAIGVCNTDDTFTTVIIRDIPEVKLPPDTSICGPQSLNLSSPTFAPTIDTNFSSINAYRWQISGGAYQYQNGTDSTRLNPVVGLLDTGTYRIIFQASNACGFSLGDTLQIRIKPVPEITTDLSGILWACPGDSVFPPNILAIPATASFSWSNNNTAVGLGASGSGQIPDFVAGNNQTGNALEAKVSLIASLEGCNSPTDTLIIRVRPTPEANPISDIQVCSGDTVVVPDFSSNPPGASFSWKNLNDSIGLDSAGTGNIPDFISAVNNTANPISGMVIFTPVLNGCVGESDSFQIHVLPRAKVTSTQDTVFCPNAQVNNFSFQTLPSNAALKWYNSNPLIGLSDSGTGNLPNFTTANNPGISNISATIVVIPELGTCQGISDTFLIEIRPAPQLQTTTDSIFCPGDSIKISAFQTTPAGTQTYWFNSDTLIGLSNNGVGNLPHFKALQNMSGNNRIGLIRVIPEINGCRGLADSFELIIKPTPSTINLVDTAFCPGDSILFPPFQSDPTGASFEWANADTNLGLGPSGTGNLPKFKAIANNTTASISSKIKVIPTLNQCVGSPDSFIFSIKPTPELPPLTDVSVCPFDTIAVDSFKTSPNGSTFQWLNDNLQIGLGSSGNGQINPYQAPDNNDTFSRIAQIRIMAVLNQCPGLEDTFLISIKAKPRVNAGLNDLICEGKSIEIGQKADTLIAYTWTSIPLGFSSNNATEWVNPDTTTLYLLQAFDSITHCLNFDSVLIEVNPVITDNTIAQNQIICAGQSPASLQGSTPGGGNSAYSYQWQLSEDSTNWTIIPLATGINYSPTVLTVNTHYRRITFSGPCGDTSNIVRIIVTPGIANNLIGDSDSLCAFTLSDTLRGSLPSGGSSAFTYSWYSTTDTSSQDTLIVGATGRNFYPGLMTQTRHYRRVVNSGSCDTRSNWVTLVVKPKPLADFSVNNVCFELAHSLTNQSSIASGSIDSFFWDMGDGNFYQTQNPSHVYGSSGAKQADLIVKSDFGCLDTVSKNFFTHPKPQAGFAAHDTCLELVNRFLDQSSVSSGNLMGWSWQFGDGDTSSLRNPNKLYADTGVFAVELIVRSDSGCLDTATGRVEIHPKPIAGFVSEDICLSQNAHFTDTSQIAKGQIAVWRWDFGDLSSDTVRHPVKNYALADTFDVIQRVRSDKGCLDTAYGQVIVYPPVSNNSIAENDTICAGSQSHAFTGSSPQGGTGTYGYQWEQSTDSLNWTSVPSATSVNLPAQTLFTTTYFRRVVSSSPCDSNERSLSNTVVVIVTPGITNNLIGDSDSLCAFTLSDTLRGSLPSGGSSAFTYSWYSTTDTSSQDTLINGATGRNFYPGLMTQTRHYRRVVNSGSCDTRSNWVTLVVKPKPLADFAVNNVCFELAHSLTNQSSIASGSNDSFFWDMGDGNLYRTQNPSHIYGSSGAKQVELIVKSDFGCLDTVSKSFFTHPKPQAGFAAHDTCLELVNRFLDKSAVSSGNLMGWSWQFGDGDTSSLRNPNKLYADTGVFAVELIVRSDSGCLDTATGRVEIHPKPIAGFVSEDVCLSQNAHFTDTSQISKGQIVGWRWDFGDLSSDTVRHPVKNYALADTFDVIQRVRSDKGCLDTTYGQVIVYPPVSNNSIAENDTICAGSQSHAFTGSTPQGGTGTYSYQWEQSTDSLNWTSVLGATNLDLSAQTLFTTTYFRRVVSSSPCDSNERSLSNTVVVIVTPGISDNTIQSDQTICFAQVSDTTRGSNPIGGTGSFTYQWQQSSNDTNWTNITGETGRHLLGRVLFDTVYYRRIVYSQACELVSNRVKVAVKPLPQVGFLQDNVCFPEVSVFNDTSIINQGQIQSRRFYFGDGDSSDASNPSHDYAADGFYSVKLQVTSNFGCVDSLIKTHQVYPKPISRMVQQNVCFPFAMNFHDSSSVSLGSIVSWNYSFGDGSSSTQQHPSHTYSLDTLYSASLIVSSNFGCKDTATRLVRVWPKPTPKWNATEVCFPDTTQFIDSTTIKTGQIKSWRWDFGDGGTDTLQNPTYQYNVFGSYQVKLFVLSDSNCLDSFIQNIEVRPLPIVTFSFDTLGCLNAPNILSNQTQRAQFYDWDFGNGNSDTAFEPQPSYNGIGQYIIKLRATTQYGCLDSFQSQIRIIAPPQPDIDLSLDSGCGPLQISFANHTVAEFSNYTWDLGNGNGSTDSLPGDQIYPPGHFSDTVYYVSLKVENKCGIDSVLDSVLVLPQPTAVIGLNVNQGCSPFALPIMNISYGRPDSFTWIYGDGDTAHHSLLLHSHTYLTGLEDTTYYLSLIVSNKCGVDTGYGQVLIKPNTVTSFFNTDTSFGCAPMTVQFTDFSNGSENLFYDFGDGNTTLQTDPTHTFVNPGSYRVQQFVDNGCSYDTSEITIQVLPSIEPKFVVNKNQECAGIDFQFTNQTTGFGALRWYFGDGDSSDNSNPNHAYQNAGNFTVKLKVFSALNGCPSVDSLPLNVLALPVPQVSLSTNQGCPPFTPNIQNNSSNAQFYEWHFGDGNTAVNHTPINTYTQSGTYTLKLITRSTLGCFDSITTQVEVFPVPTASFDFTLDNVCDTPATLTLLNTSQGASGFVWDFGGGNQSSVNNPTRQYNQFGVFTVALNVENMFGCTDRADSVFEIFNGPRPNFTYNPASGCMPLEISFTNQTLGGSNYVWDFGNGDQSIEENPIYTYLMEGLYSVSLKVVGDGNCVDSIRLTDIITVHPKPEADFSYQLIDNEPMPQGLVRFTNLTQNVISYAWDLGDGNNSIEENPEHRYRYNGSYIVELAVENQFGCLDTVWKEIPLTFFKGLFVPNAFTPEYGTPEVRVFKPSGVSLKTYHLQIFDTWGKLIWESKELSGGQPAEGWDGRVDGKLMAQDVYVWKVTAEFEDGSIWPGMRDGSGNYRRTGTVTLLR